MFSHSRATRGRRSSSLNPGPMGAQISSVDMQLEELWRQLRRAEEDEEEVSEDEDPFCLPPFGWSHLVKGSKGKRPGERRLFPPPLGKERSEIPPATPEMGWPTTLFNGNVRAMANRMLQYTMAKGVDDAGQASRLLTWVTYSGASWPPDKFINRRMPTRWEGDAEIFAPISDEPAADGGVGLSQPSRGMRADAMAQRIKNDPMRILDALAIGVRNRTWNWVVGIARAITKSGIGDGTLRNWEMKTPYRAASDRRRYANNIRYAIDLWAHGGESEEEDTTTEDGGARIWKWDDTKARDSFAKLVVYGPMAQDLRAQGICPFCLYIDISGCFPEERLESRGRPPREYTDQELTLYRPLVFEASTH